MVQSNFEMRIEAAWPAISAALQDGLKEEEGHELKTLVTLVERPSDLARHVTLGWSLPDYGNKTFTDETLAASAGPVHQLRWTWRNKLDQRAINIGPDERLLGELRKWATASRKEEYRWILRRIAKIAKFPAGRFKLEPDAFKFVEKGWRVVVFEHAGGDGLEKLCKDKGVELVERILTQPLDGLVALAYPAGAFAVARIEDLTPGFDYEADNQSICPILSERIELIGFTYTVGAHKYTRLGTFP